MKQAESTNLAHLQQELDALQVELIRREHRWVQAISNLVKSRQWAPGDKRKAAAKFAFLLKIFAPTTIAVTIGGGGILLAYLNFQAFRSQNLLLGDANVIMKEQLSAISDQFGIEDYRRKIQRKTELIGTLWTIQKVAEVPYFSRLQQDEIPHEKVWPVATEIERREASVEYVRLLLDLGMPVDLQGARLDGIHGNAEWASVVKPYCQRAILRWADLRGLDLSDSDMSSAQLLYSDLSGADLRGATLVNADFRGAQLSRSFLADAKMANANLLFAKLDSVSAVGTKLLGVHAIGSSLLFRPKKYDPKHLFGSLHCWDESTLFPSPGFRPRLEAQNPKCIGFNRRKGTLTKGMLPSINLRDDPKAGPEFQSDDT